MVTDCAVAVASDLCRTSFVAADFDWRGGDKPDDLSLEIAESPSEVIGVVAGLAGRQSRPAFAGDDTAGGDEDTCRADVYADPVLISVTRVIDAITRRGESEETVRAQMIRDMAESFRKLDAQYGSSGLLHQVVMFLGAQVAAIRDMEPDADTFTALGELAQLAGWLARDSEYHPTAQRWYIQALALAEHGGDPVLAARIVSAMSQQSGALGHWRQSIALAETALTRAEKGAPELARAIFHHGRASAYARAGRSRECMASLDAMEHAVAAHDARPGEEDCPAWAAHVGRGDVLHVRGHCMRLLGDPSAVDLLSQARGELPPARKRANACAAADLALAYAKTPGRHLDAALEAGHRAITLASRIGSGRLTGMLRELDRALARFGTVAVREWRTAARPLLRGPDAT